MADIGKRIKELRTERGMTQQQLADASGLPRHKIGKVETGERAVAATEIASIADAPGVSSSAVVRPPTAACTPQSAPAAQAGMSMRPCRSGPSTAPAVCRKPGWKVAPQATLPWCFPSVAALFIALNFA